MALRKISEYSMLYPHWYVLEGVECESHEDGGGFCDVHKGRHGNLKLCLKVVKVYLDKPMDGMLKVLQDFILISIVRELNRLITSSTPRKQFYGDNFVIPT